MIMSTLLIKSGSKFSSFNSDKSDIGMLHSHTCLVHELYTFSLLPG